MSSANVKPVEKAGSSDQKKGKLELVSSSDDNLSGLDLLGTITRMSDSLTTMKEIIQKANFIALNASIEAARTQTQTENFSLVADQVKRQAERTEELAIALNGEVEELENRALHAISVNFTDVANDVIDKIDRNLFERNCDMQAWAGFTEIMECAKRMRGKNAAECRQAFEDKESDLGKSIAQSRERLSILAKTYNVYIDCFLLNDKGIVIASARDESIIGRDLSGRHGFKTVMSTNEIYVTDMSFDDTVQSNTVSYIAPVRDDNDQPIGCISNQFNWHYVQDMVDKMPLGEEGQIQVISKDGTILCSRNRKGVLVDNLAWLMAGEHAIDKESGYTVECSRNGQLGAWGFCHTFGYNAYAGKEWSAIVSHPVHIPVNKFICENITREVDGKKQAAPNANRNLERVAERIQDHVRSINAINNETNMLAVNAAIQAGVAGAEGEAFSVIASEIGQLARQSEDFVNNINKLTKHLESCVRETVFTRLGEAAFDCIDKVDRNLYERNCDVQAFATFHEIEMFLLNEDADDRGIQDLLRKLHEIYEVYHDIILLDADGNVKSAAIHKELIGQNQGDRSWFRECVSGNLVVSDLYYSKSINDYTVTYAAPVRDSGGKVIGVLTTRFNCEFVYDIMKATIVGHTAKVYLVNSRGIVIGSPTGDGILEDSFAHLRAFKNLSKKPHGHTVEADSKDGDEKFAFGYAKTQGYINYKGKGWGIVIKQSLDEEEEHTTMEVAKNDAEESDDLDVEE